MYVLLHEFRIILFPLRHILYLHTTFLLPDDSIYLPLPYYITQLNDSKCNVM